MAEQLDIAMNQFPIATNLRYIYGEDAVGNQVKLDMTKYFLMKNLDGTDANDMIENGIRLCMGNVDNIPYPYGTLTCFSQSSGQIVQQFSPAINTSEFYIRQYSSQRWSAWAKL